MTTDCILVLNAGSSSLKFSAYRPPIGERADLIASGQVEGLKTSPRLAVHDDAGATLVDRPLAGFVRDSGSALQELARWLRSYLQEPRILGVGHRVVHGGAQHRAPTIVTPQALEELKAFAHLAPLHQPHNLAAIEAVGERLPGIAQVACFDTSFHRGRPAIADLVPLPREICERGVQRYGFHGLSYEYIAAALPAAAPQIAGGRVIVAHLGSGASLCALHDCKPIDSTFGFTALDGLCMGTRPGSVDPGVILYLFQSLNLSAKAVEEMLYTRSGLFGISGLSSDMRDLLASSEPRARLAVDFFVRRVLQEIGALTATLGGLDGLVFTAGVGANSPEIRRRICEGCRWLGLELDAHANARNGPCISRAASRISTWVIPTNEELMIARHTSKLLPLRASGART